MDRVIASAAMASAVLLAFRPQPHGVRVRDRLVAICTRALAAADVDVRPARALLGWTIAAVAAAVIAALIGGPVLAAIALLLAIAVPAAWLHANADRSLRRADAGLPALLEAAAAGVRAGDSLRTALVDAAATAPGRAASDLRQLLAVDDRRTAAAVTRWEARWPTPDVRLAAAAVSLALVTGGAAARSLDAVAATIRERGGIAHEVRALSTQARVSAFVLGIGPVVFGVLAGAIDPSTARFLLATTPGQLCLATGIALDAGGLLWMHRLTKAVGP